MADIKKIKLGNEVYNVLDDSAVHTVNSSGTGNAFTEISQSGSTVTLVKGTTFATSAELASEANSRESMDTTLSNRIDSLESRGRYLSGWNCSTGLPSTYPTPTSYPYTYTYRAGDYYIIEAVGASDNLRPYGSTITKESASDPWVVGSITEASTVKAGDLYTYDGTNWVLTQSAGADTNQKVKAGSVTFDPNATVDFVGSGVVSIVGDASVNKITVDVDSVEAGSIAFVDTINIGSVAASISASAASFEAEIAGALALKSTVSASDLDSSLQTSISSIASKVDKTQTIAGIDLQDNITKAELLTALNVADGAQVNVIENVAIGSIQGSVSNKVAEFTAIEAGTLATLNSVSVSVLDASLQASISAIANKVDKNGTDRLMTADEGTKLAGIETGAEVNAIAHIQVNSSEITPINKVVNITLGAMASKDTVGAADLDSSLSATIAGKLTNVEIGSIQGSVSNSVAHFTARTAGELAILNKSDITAASSGGHTHTFDGGTISIPTVTPSKNKYGVTTSTSQFVSGISTTGSKLVTTSITPAVASGTITPAVANGSATMTVFGADKTASLASAGTAKVFNTDAIKSATLTGSTTFVTTVSGTFATSFSGGDSNIAYEANYVETATDVGKLILTPLTLGTAAVTASTGTVGITTSAAGTDSITPYTFTDIAVPSVTSNTQVAVATVGTAVSVAAVGTAVTVAVGTIASNGSGATVITGVTPNSANALTSAIFGANTTGVNLVDDVTVGASTASIAGTISTAGTHTHTIE